MELQSGRVTVEEGGLFGAGGGRPLRCDVFRPPQPAAAAPAVLLVHGGAWRNGDRTQLRGYGIQLGRRGLVCVACEYRLSGEATWPAPLHDVKAALRWMRTNSTALGIDPERISISGNSAGAHLALMVAGTPNRPEFEGDGGHAGVGTHVAAAIGFYAPTVLGRRGAAAVGGSPTLTESEAALMGADVSDAALEAASPATYAGPDFPPTMLITGNRDDVVPQQASLHMYRVLCDAGASAELHTFNGAPHAFDVIPEFGRRCVDLMTHFLDRHVVNPRPVELPAVVS